MINFCGLHISIVLVIAEILLGAALLLALVGAVMALIVRGKGEPSTQENAPDASQVAPIIDALKGLIEALGKAPAWFALFLAGLFLFWMATQAYADLCRPTAANPAANQQDPSDPSANQQDPGDSPGNGSNSYQSAPANGA